MEKCPKCRRPGQKVPGYLINGGRITRCEVCKGWGFATILAIMGYELSR